MRTLALLMVMLGASGCSKKAAPANYEFPTGFQGRFAVEYSVTSQPPLPLVAGRQVVTLSAAGYLATSTAQTFGTIDARFERGGKPLTFAVCSGVSCKLADGEVALLGTGTETTGGVTRQIEFGAVGPCEVGFDAPPLPPRE